ncbi:MAG: protein kinase [Gemmatimonadaceae bacterium]|nr:protein kinase [Gemmatimonadaceae bacterium]
MTPTYAQQLLGRTLKDDWTVVEHIPRRADATGGHFSESYIVQNPAGERAFLKALDFSEALTSPDPARALQPLTAAYNFERDLLFRCRDRRLDRVVVALDDGSVLVDTTSPAGVVQYLIFELADGDIRKHLKIAAAFDLAWALRSLHQVAIGITQLHANQIAHQDLKPSNVMVFGAKSSKVGDLGRAAAKGEQPPHEGFPVAGDRSYAPPEFLYGATPTDWAPRRLGCDAYLLGSMQAFLFTGVGITSMWMAELDPQYHWKNWRGTFAEVLPYVRDAFGRATTAFSATVPDEYRSELRTILQQLCDPDPTLRGHPRNRASRGNQFGLERFVSAYNRLATQAERGINKARS